MRCGGWRADRSVGGCERCSWAKGSTESGSGWRRSETGCGGCGFRFMSWGGSTSGKGACYRGRSRSAKMARPGRGRTPVALGLPPPGPSPDKKCYLCPWTKLLPISRSAHRAQCRHEWRHGTLSSVRHVWPAKLPVFAELKPSAVDDHKFRRATRNCPGLETVVLVRRSMSFPVSIRSVPGGVKFPGLILHKTVDNKDIKKIKYP